MSWLRLYLRSRRLPVALAVATAAACLVWASWLASAEPPTVDVRLVTLTVMLATAAFGATLSGADDALDHTASINWPLRRGAHLLLAGVVITGLLSLTVLTDSRFEPFAVVLRNTAGMLGLTALGAALFGTARSWIAPLVWTLISVLPVVQPSEDARMQVVGWLVQSADSALAAACAVVLAATGLLAYTVLGCPLVPGTQTASDP